MRIFLLLIFICIYAGNIEATTKFINQKDEDHSKDSIRNKIDINNRLARHFMDIQPLLAFYYADSAANVSMDIHYFKGLLESFETKGLVYLVRENYQEALSNFEKSINLASTLQDTLYIVKSHLHLSDVLIKMSNFDLAEEQLTNAMQYPQIRDFPLYHANALIGLWQIYWSRGINDTVLHFQTEAFRIYQENKEDLALAEELANGFLNIKDYDKALEFYNQSLEYRRKNGDKKAEADDMVNIGEIYLSVERGKEALKYFEEAKNYYLSEGIKTSLYEVSMDMGLAYYFMQEYKNAINHLNDALEIADAIGSIPFQAKINQLLAEVHEASGSLPESINYYKKFISFKDSLYDIETATRTAALKANFEFDQMEKEISLLRKEKEKLNERARYKDQINHLNTNLIIILAISIILIVLLAVLIYFRYKAKKEANKLLSRQYVAISQQKMEIEKKSDIIRDNNVELKRARKIIESKNKALRDANEKLESLVDQRTMELNRTYSKLSFHIDNTPLAVLEWNDKMELIRWSSQAEKMFGWRASEMLGKHIQNIPLVKKDHKDSIDKIFAELLTGEKPRNFYKNQNYHKNGSLIDVEWSNSILFNEEGRLESILSIANDVTVREKAVTDLKHSNNELDNFIYRASHDLRGPITRLVGVVNLGMLEAKEPVSRKYFDILGKVAFEMNAMLSRLLTVHDIYQYEVQIEELPIKETLKGYIEEFKQKNLTFSVNMTYDIPLNLKWKTDVKLFKIAIQNLIENAYVNSVEQDARITIRVDNINDYFLKFSVSDNGLGFSEDVVEKIFEMFFQGTEKSNVNYGLGLYLVKKAVEKMGGSVSITKPVNDTTFEIILPNLQVKKATVKKSMMEL